MINICCTKDSKRTSRTKMGLSRTQYNNLAKTPELGKDPEYFDPEMDKDLQY